MRPRLAVSVALALCAASQTGAPLLAAGQDSARAAAAAAACLTENSGDAPFDRLVREPVRHLLVEGRPAQVSGLLCAASGIGKDGVESHWFWFDLDARTASSLGDNPARAEGLRASPDGRYLAVEALSEALTHVDVIDLAALIRNGRYRVAATLGAFPGSVTIEGWTGDGTLRVTGDMLLSHPPHGASRARLELFGGPERFVWSIDTGTVVAESAALRDPVRYSCDHLAAPHPQTRMMAVHNLRFLPSAPAAACLETALSLEADASVREEILWALSELGKR